MKNLFILLLMVCATGIFAQTFDKSKFSSPAKLSTAIADQDFPSVSKLIPVSAAIPQPTGLKSTSAVNQIAIGQAGNAYGFAYMRTTYLWADNDINSITLMHRMLNPPGTGYLAYDVSMDGGATWSNNIQVYNPTLPDGFNARYPQGVLYNPTGNTNPDNAYFSYFAPTLDGSNTGGGNDWGGYAWGTKKLASGSLPTQHNQTSANGFKQFLPSGFTLTQLGETWLIDEENDGSSGTYVYTGNLILGHGTWNASSEEFDYSFEHMELEIDPDDGINDVKVAFAPDGMTGWICVLSNRVVNLPYTMYHPILFKTTDGGQTWSDPIEVQLGGVDGLDEVKNFIADSTLEEHFTPDPVPPRDEIPYFMGFHMDFAVDAWGNPHILGVVAICDLEAGTWWNYPGVFAMFHIYTSDQGATWKSFNIDYLQTFDVEYNGSSGGVVNQYNRPQVATTDDGKIVFFSFLDTHFPGSTDNDQPDIFFRDYIPSMDQHSAETENVTYLSNAMEMAKWGCMSHYVFADVSGSNYTCTIPFAYQAMTGVDPDLPVQFWYIPDFEKSYVVTGIDPASGPLASGIQNYPNPCSDITNININLLQASDVSITLYNTLGQKVREYNFGMLSNGPHKLTLELKSLDRGAYFYTMVAGRSNYSGKMLVE
ncbi:T9SS type A sorting domain-containing protein [Bacteroidota bacterium]